MLTRRDFLINSLVVGVEVASLRLRLDQFQVPLKIGFLGLGTRGHANLACMATEASVRITAICDVAKTQLDKAAQLLSNNQHSCVRTYSDPQAFLRSEKTDFIVISLPPPAQRSIFQYALENERNFASETPILSAAAARAGELTQSRSVQLLPRRVLASCGATPHFLLSEPVNTIQIVHRSARRVPANTREALKDWLFEELGDSIDAAASLFELDTLHDCNSLSSMRRGGLREFAFRFSQTTNTQTKRLNISVTAPADSFDRNQPNPSPVSSETFVMAESRHGRFCARTIVRPQSTTKLYLSNLAQAVAETSPPSLLHPLSTRLTSHSIITTAVNQLGC
jgi:Oxidoreductase family, NAD-binding Rossmann fold